MHMLGRASQTLLEGKKKHIIQRAHKRKVEASDSKENNSNSSVPTTTTTW